MAAPITYDQVLQQICGLTVDQNNAWEAEYPQPEDMMNLSTLQVTKWCVTKTKQPMKDMKHHFHGGDEKYKRLQAARSRLLVLHYKHEKIISFDKATTCVKKHYYDTIALCDFPETESNENDTLLKKIKTNCQQLQNVVTIVRGNPIKYYDNFTKMTFEFACDI